MMEAPADHPARKKFGAGYHVIVPIEGERDGMIGAGIDSKGRIKREYSDEFNAGRSRLKFQRISALQKKMAEVDDRLRDGGAPPPPDNDDDAVLLLIRSTGLRPGSNRDRGGKVETYGATTLQAKHVVVSGDGVRLVFTGKNGKALSIDVADPDTTAMLLDRAKGAADEDELFPEATQDTVNARLKSLAGVDFKPKDLRTLLATATAHDAVARLPIPGSAKEAVKWRNQIAQEVADMLGNTKAVTLARYINPDVWGGWPLEAS
jgi:DNA topoisomerase-1